MSAGLLLFRRKPAFAVFIAHPGGPFWENRDEGVWTIPKGLVEEGEDMLHAALREFEEETGIVPAPPFFELGSVKQKAGKTIFAWAFEGDADPLAVRSNTMKCEWPRGSGRWHTFPEVDRCAWVEPEEAKSKLNKAQAELVDRLASLRLHL